MKTIHRVAMVCILLLNIYITGNFVLFLLFWEYDFFEYEQVSTDITDFQPRYEEDGIIATRYLEDKISIAQSFLDNTEAFRIVGMHKDGDTIPTDKTDMIGDWSEADSHVFWGYANRWLPHYKDTFSPLEISTQIKPHVDTIFYSPDSLLCVALVIVEKKYAKIKGYEDEKNGFDGLSLVGWRENKDQRFRIYANGQLYLVAFPNYEGVLLDLKRYYFENIIRNINPRYLSAEPYKYGVNDPRFFETAAEFKKNDRGEYNMIYDGNKKFNLYSNTPEYVNRKVSEEEKARLRTPLKKLTVGY